MYRANKCFSQEGEHTGDLMHKRASLAVDILPVDVERRIILTGEPST
jgi:hypothetical protein